MPYVTEWTAEAHIDQGVLWCLYTGYLHGSGGCARLGLIGCDTGDSLTSSVVQAQARTTARQALEFDLRHQKNFPPAHPAKFVQGLVIELTDELTDRLTR